MAARLRATTTFREKPIGSSIAFKFGGDCWKSDTESTEQLFKTTAHQAPSAGHFQSASVMAWLAWPQGKLPKSVPPPWPRGEFRQDVGDRCCRSSSAWGLGGCGTNRSSMQGVLDMLQAAIGPLSGLVQCIDTSQWIDVALPARTLNRCPDMAWWADMMVCSWRKRGSPTGLV